MADRFSEADEKENCFYDFFAGAGLVRLGLKGWKCLWAIDIDPKKCEVYVNNFGPDALVQGDIADVDESSIPGTADLAWASFPCQDLSLAGPRTGIYGNRSGVFWHFHRLMKGLLLQGRLPSVIVVENVMGLLRTGNLEAVCKSLAELGLCFGALVIDAKHFLPQSRPRVFVVASSPASVDASGLAASECPSSPWFPRPLLEAFLRLQPDLKALWRWWRLPIPRKRVPCLSEILEEEPTGVEWHAPEETKRLFDLMSPGNRAKVEEARRAGRRVVGAIYKRIRNGSQRAEIRLDGIAGCLRTPQGGSSRQVIMIIEGERTRSRLLSPREAARLMGVPDSFWLPPKYNDAYKAMGDGVAVPVTEWLCKHLLEPLVAAARAEEGAARARKRGRPHAGR